VLDIDLRRLRVAAFVDVDARRLLPLLPEPGGAPLIEARRRPFGLGAPPAMCPTDAVDTDDGRRFRLDDDIEAPT
jgi:hypothetical protein